MDHFTYQNGSLHAENVPLSRIAQEYGTPVYVYSRAAIRENATALQHAMAVADVKYSIHYSVKTCSNLAILQELWGLGCGFETVSGGELGRVQKVLASLAGNGKTLNGSGAGRNGTGGGQGSRLTTAETTVFSGVGKTDVEIATALMAGVKYICVESAEELWAVRDIAAGLRTGPAPVGVRINPDVDAKTHPGIATGLKENKFGIEVDEAVALLKKAHADPDLEVVAVSCHIGSQITGLGPFVEAAKRLAEVTKLLLEAGVPLKYVGMGGGLGIRYQDETPPTVQEYGRAISDVLGPSGLEIMLEPGRAIVGNASVLLNRVVRTKENDGRRFVILDAGMTELIRTAMYRLSHGIDAVSEAVQNRPKQKQDVVGPVCESSDYFAKAQPLPPFTTNDLVVLRSAGAYGFTMSSNFNGRCRTAEVMVDGREIMLIRQRERVEDLWRGEMDLQGQPFSSDWA